ncbi:MFS transporter [Coxiella burnetii]|uniref:Multidrug resistance transporter, Bcr family n=2 Tax=Coxiella burnetii TaxID=777 RepID=A9KDX4_COXBN|nr:MFS transporter [Coxiella burnetii]ABS77853.1 multidrug resistance transporter, Bcr family [Coxiella burnetii Dugway 5J108-111]OYK80470.1 MFS transporter [Coxiella burnetii]OYK82428.1 MFS transporter [Coxiella burnetii]
MAIGKLKVMLLLSYICIASISAAIITPALPHIKQAFALTNGALEWVISIFLFGYVMGQLIYAPLANRFGRLTALRYGLMVNLIGILLCIMATKASSYFLLLIGRLVTALGAASGLSCTFMLLNELLPPAEARHAMSFAIVSFTLGIGLAVTLGGLITQYLHWQDCFWILLAHGMAILFFTGLYQETLKKPIALHPRTILLGYLQALKSRQLIIFSLTAGLTSTFAYSYSAAAPLYAQINLHLSPSQYGYWNLINMTGMLASGFLSAFLIKWCGIKRFLLSGFGFMVPVLVSLITLSLANHSHILWFFMTTMLLYLFTGLLFPAASYFASNAIADKASASSMMSFINMGSAMIGVVVLGYLPFASIISLTVIILAFFSLTSISVLLYFLRRPTGEQNA